MKRRQSLLGLGAAGVVASTLRRPAGAQAAAHVRIGNPGQEGNAGAYYAQDGGYFRRAGIDAEIVTLRAGSGTGVVAAVVGGSLEVGEADLVGLATARERGIPVSLIAASAVWSSTLPTAGLLVQRGTVIRNGKDLEGKTLGVPSLGGLSRITTTVWIEKNGGDATKVKFVEVPQAEMSATLQRGTLTGVVATEPTLTKALAEGGSLVASMYDAIGNGFIETAWFSTDEWIGKNMEIAMKTARAIRDAQKWANANRTEAAAIYRKYSAAGNETRIKATYGESLDPARMQPLLDAAVRYHSLPQPFNARDMISAAAGAA
jgi:NitT/TauT family transport system substrate-binding protein